MGFAFQKGPFLLFNSNLRFSFSIARSGLLRVLSDLANQNANYIFGRLDSDRYESFASSYVDRATPRPTFFVMDAQKQVYWTNSSIPHKKAAIEAYLDGIAAGTIPSSSTAASGIYRFLNQVTQFMSDILEDPITLGAVVILFVFIVMVAVWFLSSSVSEEDVVNSGPGQHKASVTIENPTKDSSGKLKTE